MAALIDEAGITREHPVFDLGGYAATALSICHDLCEDMALLDQNQKAAG